MSLIVEAGLVAALSLSNTPWIKKDYQFPYLMVEKRIDNFFINSYNSSRTAAANLNQFNPQTALWRISGGYRFKLDDGEVTLELGHQSEHELGIKDTLTESYNFISVKYRIEVP